MIEFIVTHEKALNLAQIELDGSGYSRSYAKAVKRKFIYFLKWAESRLLTNLYFITKNDIYDYQNHLLSIVSKQTGKFLSCGTLSGMYNAVKLLFSVICRAKLINENITSSINFELPKRERLERQAFSEEAMSEILEKMDIKTDLGLRDRALFELIYSSGLRVCEASNLKIKDLCMEQREMIVRGKFSRDRVVPFSKMAHHYLKLYLEKRKNTDIENPVFCAVKRRDKSRAITPNSIGRRFTDLLKQYNMKRDDLCAHSIRHTSATMLLDNGAGIRHVQELLGHKKIETTAGYTHTQNNSIAKIYRKYHPLEHDLFDAVDDDYIKNLDFLTD